MDAPTLGERCQYLAARAVGWLPDRAKILLSGEPPIVVDGHALDPQIQLLRSATQVPGTPGLLEPGIAEARARFRRHAAAFRGPVTPVGAVRDVDIRLADRTLSARHYTPAGPHGTASLPLTVYFHGGGFVIGDLDTHDEPCRLLCRESRSQVLSVAYRLAPEHPFPAAVEDARDAFTWAASHSGSLGADPARVGVAGDSAGANLAAVVCGLRLASPPASQLLIYPPTDSTARRPSLERFVTRLFLTAADRDGFFSHYVGSDRDAGKDPRVSPLLAPHHRGLPPAVVAVAGYDILRDEGEAYADVLRAAGCEIELKRFHGLVHGFVQMTGVSAAARAAVVAIAKCWGARLEKGPAT